jgi:hypothetical protein
MSLEALRTERLGNGAEKARTGTPASARSVPVTKPDAIHGGAQKTPKELEELEDKAGIMGGRPDGASESRCAQADQTSTRNALAGTSSSIAIRRLRSSELHSPDFHQTGLGTDQLQVEQLMQHWQRQRTTSMQLASLDRDLPVDFHYQD